ncbi:hypothetical protein JNUCC1_03075 [Lentibacillus sp. JNUCC-1]|uniref:hypothetical protein n=1 Tax=Lentibacillus sp. JNUCC-1 TaxID=2654513 RepID=UPI0012E8B8F2|nr:hypothetical protein [Lentibacillus sp. JNUCC-1]MUV39202.1 hypothetical protein [Lentibacillus sp. JNUCC-1]
MRTFIQLLLLVLFMGLAACSSPEADELADYHNRYVEEVNPKADKIDEHLNKIAMIEAMDEALAYQKENINPLVEDIMTFIQQQEPNSDVVKEVHEMRAEQLKLWKEGFDLRTEAMKEAANEAAEAQINSLVEQSDNKMIKAAEYAQQANEKIASLADQYEFELKE